MRCDRMTVNDKSEGMWKEAVLIYCKVPFLKFACEDMKFANLS